MHNVSVRLHQEPIREGPHSHKCNAARKPSTVLGDPIIPVLVITGDKKDTGFYGPILASRAAEFGNWNYAVPTAKPAPSSAPCTASICMSRPHSLGLTAG